MIFTNKFYILITVAGVLIVGITCGSLWSDHKIRKMESEIARAKAHSELVEKEAADKEMQSISYKAKIEYLESKLAEFSAIARRQDEELQKLKSNSAAAHNDVNRARSVRSVATTADELCAKLSELGHPCG